MLDYWNKRRSNEGTLTFRDISVSHGSIGQVFKLPEWEVRERLERLYEDSDGLLRYQETAALQRVVCPDRGKASELELLAQIYQQADMEAHASALTMQPRITQSNLSSTKVRRGV
jgi:hypothetical protein